MATDKTLRFYPNIRNLRCSKYLLTIAKSILLLPISAILLHSLIINIIALDNNSLAEISDWYYVLSGKFLPFLWAEWSSYLGDLGISIAMIVLALIFSAGISIILGYQWAQKNRAAYWDILGGLFSFTSGLPLFVIGLMIYVWSGHDYSNDSTLLWKNILYGGLILGLCEGALGEWPRNFKLIFEELQDKSYYLAHKARGQSIKGLAYGAIKIYLLRNLATRISYLFGAVIVVEHSLDCRGIGYRFLDVILGNSPSYNEAIISGLLLVLVPLFVRTCINIYLVDR
jgi:ABC-type dipeptide/oligopeptide/nickel transport system permease component